MIKSILWIIYSLIIVKYREVECPTEPSEVCASFFVKVVLLMKAHESKQRCQIFAFDLIIFNVFIWPEWVKIKTLFQTSSHIHETNSKLLKHFTFEMKYSVSWRIYYFNMHIQGYKNIYANSWNIIVKIITISSMQ